MTWETVPQSGGGYGQNREAAVSLSILPMRGITLMHLSLGPDVARRLQWAAEMRIGLAVGRGEHEGFVRFAPADRGGRALGKMPRGTGFLKASFRAPPDLARWNCPRAQADYTLDVKGQALVAKLPWDLDPAILAAAEAEAARAAGGGQ